MLRKFLITGFLLPVLAAAGLAQAPGASDTTQIQPLGNTNITQVRVVSHSISAINYRNRSNTRVDFNGTNLAPSAKGEAKVNSRTGQTQIDTKFEHLVEARSFGPQFLTYVLWAVTPEGRANNLGEVIPNHDGKVEMKASTNLQSFGLIVTAEPYFAVSRPSDMIVLENVAREDTKGSEVPIQAKFEAQDRADYAVNVPVSQLPAVAADRKTPLQLLEARNALTMARASGAEQYAPEAYQRAQSALDRAESDRGDSKALHTAARAATQSAEDARLLTIQRRQEQQRVATQQQASAAQLQAQVAQQQADLARQQADFQKTQAEISAQQRAAAEQQRQQAVQQQQAMANQAQNAERRAAAAEQNQEQMRARLRDQLNQVLQTRDTARGLIVNMNDVLFDTGRATLKPDAKLRLAKVAGIIEAYPDLHLQIEGYTDNTGTAQINQVLSERRAATVRDYLIAQGVPVNNVVARGFGEENPVASNDSPAGRQQNRRVDLVVSGDSIGNEVGMNAGSGGGISGATGSTSTGSVTDPTAPGAMGRRQQ